MTQKMHFSEYIFKTFLKELVIFLDIISVCSVSKTAASSQVFFLSCFRNSTKKISILFKVLPVHFNNSLCTIQTHAFC